MDNEEKRTGESERMPWTIQITVTIESRAFNSEFTRRKIVHKDWSEAYRRVNDFLNGVEE